MTAKTIYVCDAGGENCVGETESEAAVTAVPVRFSSGTYEHPIERTAHVCEPCGGQDVRRALAHFEWFTKRRPGPGADMSLMDEYGKRIGREDIVDGKYGNAEAIQRAIDTVEMII